METETKSTQLYGGEDMSLHIEDEYGRRYKVVDKVPADYMIWNNGYFTGGAQNLHPILQMEAPR